MDIDKLDVRTLQKESARALSCMVASNNNIHQFKQAHHNSHNWYKAVVNWYISEYGDLPSKAGPGIDVKLILED